MAERVNNGSVNLKLQNVNIREGETDENLETCENRETCENDENCENDKNYENDKNCENDENCENDKNCDNPLIIVIKGEKKKKKTKSAAESKGEEKTSSNSYHTVSSMSFMKNEKGGSKKTNKKKNEKSHRYENRNKQIWNNTEHEKNENSALSLDAKVQNLKRNEEEVNIKYSGGKSPLEENAIFNKKKNYNACSTVLKKLTIINNCEQLSKNITTLYDSQTILKKKEMVTNIESVKLPIAENVFLENTLGSEKCNEKFLKSANKKLSDIKSDKIDHIRVTPRKSQGREDAIFKEILEKGTFEVKEEVMEKDNNESISELKQMHKREENCIDFHEEQATSELKEKTVDEDTNKNKISPEFLKLITDMKHIKDTINLQYRKYKHKRKQKRPTKLFRSYYYINHISPEYAYLLYQTKLNLAFYQRELDIYLSVITNLHNTVFKEREKYKELKDMLKYTTSEIEKENNKLYEELSVYKNKYNRLKNGISNIGYGSILNIKEKNDIYGHHYKDASKKWEEEIPLNNETKEEYINEDIYEDGYVIVNSTRQNSVKKYGDGKIGRRYMGNCALLKFIDF